MVDVWRKGEGGKDLGIGNASGRRRLDVFAPTTNISLISMIVVTSDGTKLTLVLSSNSFKRRYPVHVFVLGISSSSVVADSRANISRPYTGRGPVPVSVLAPYTILCSSHRPAA